MEKFSQICLLSCCSQHPKFILNAALLWPNDIAVIRVKGKINLDHPNIDKIAMAPDDDYDYTNSTCWITGWGYTKSNNIL